MQNTTVTVGPDFAVSSIFVLVVIAGVAFTLVRLLRRGHRRGSHGWGTLAIALIIAGVFMVRGRVAYESRHAGPPAPPAPPQVAHHVAVPLDQLPPDAPLDELWLKLNQPRITFDEPVAEGSAPLVDDAPTIPADTQPADAALRAAQVKLVVEVIKQAADAVMADHVPPAGADPAAPAATALAASADGADAPADLALAASDDVVAEPAAAEPAAAAPDGPPARPDWVANPPKLVGKVQRVVVQAGPYSTLQECYEQLKVEMRTAVERRVAELVRASTGQAYASVPPLDSLRLGGDYIVRELLVDQYVENGEASFGETKTAWGLLEFTQEQDDRLLDAWKGYARRFGIAKTGAIAAFIVGIIGLVLALLKIDTWTRGYYTKRLFLGVPAAIIALVALLAASID